MAHSGPVSVPGYGTRTVFGNGTKMGSLFSLGNQLNEVNKQSC